MVKLHGFVCFILAGLLLTAPVSEARAEEPAPAVIQQVGLMDYVETLYDESNGMITSEANAVVQDQNGYIWIGSYGGLSRYSGHKFENMSQDRENAPKDGIRVLFLDSQNRLWIGTNDSGIYLYEHETFRQLCESPDLTSDFLKGLSVRSMAEDLEGNLFVGTTNGLYLVNEALQISRWGGKDSMDITIQDLTRDRHGHIWGITAGNHLFILDPSEQVPFYTQNFSGIELSSGLLEASDGSFYIGTEENTIIRLEIDGDLTQGHELTPQYLSIGSKATTNDIYEDHQHKIWICTDNGLGYFEQDEHFHEVCGLSSNTMIMQICEDYEGNLWFASSRRGLIQLVRSKFKHVAFEAGISNQSTNATLLCNNKLYIGTDHGLAIMDEDGNRVDNELTALLSGIRIRNLMRDSKNGVWISTYKQYGLIHYQESTGTITSYTMDQGMTHDQVRMSLELSDGTIAAATNQGITLIKDGHVTDTFTADDGITNEVILCLAQDSSGTLYAGSDGNGIYMINLADRTVRNLTTDDGLSSGVILRITPDQENRELWISNGSSLSLCQDGSIRSIPQTIPGSGSIFDIKQTDDYLWLVKSNGIIRIKKEDLKAGNPTFHVLSRKDGLNSAITANSWNFLSGDDRLFLCSGDGVYYLHTGEIYKNTTVPKIAVSRITADESTYYGAQDILLPADTQRITFELDLLSFGFAEGTLEYFLEGFDKTFLTTGSRTENAVVYTNLPGGNYVFHLKGYNADLTASQELTFQIRKEPSFFEQQYFTVLIILALLLFLMIALAVVQTIQRSRSQKRQQEYKALTDQTIQIVSKTIDAKDKYTIGHSQRVAAYSVEIGRRFGLNEEQLEQLRYSALLHDIGKIGIPDQILNKAGKLTDEEYNTIKQHPSIGGNILKDFTLAPWIAAGASYHHERYDGRGYNEHLAGEDIPLYARIISVADAFDAMNSTRVYRPGMTTDFILSEIERGKGSQFDPVFAQILLDMIQDGFTA